MRYLSARTPQELSRDPVAVHGSARRQGDSSITGRRFTALKIAAVFAVSLFTLASAATVSAANPPAKRTYFLTLLGGEEKLGDLAFDCIKFNKNGSVCIDDNTICGTWERIEPFDDNQSIITLDVNFTEDDDDFTIHARLTVDSRGHKGRKMSSVGGTAWVVEEGEEPRSFTMAWAGKQTKAKACRQLRSELRDLFDF